MDSYELYKDIASRTNGDIYIGVVGPVRTGKSTFIKRVMDKLVLPKIQDTARKQRIIDELPQSADGKIVMTTQPKFVPDGGVKVSLSANVDINLRMVDCVGYLIDGVEGNDRMVRTPWSNEEMTFERASEIGTRKVMAEHSTIGVVVTTDGSITDFKRDNYSATEERIIQEMKALGKPFVIIVNSSTPTNSSTAMLAQALQSKHGVPVIIKNVMEMEIDDINEVLENALNEFPLVRINVDMPKWLQMMPCKSELVSHFCNIIAEASANLTKISDYKKMMNLFAEDNFIKPIKYCKADFGTGAINIEIMPYDNVFYDVMSSVCSVAISDEYSLFNYIKSASVAEREYGKLKSALDDVNTHGYGIVLPCDEEVNLQSPNFESGSGRTIRMQANASCLHIMKVDVNAEVSPIAGGGSSQEMVEYLKNEYQGKEMEIWDTNMFGKSLATIAREGLNNKMYAMPQEAQVKLRRAVTRIVNESKGGVLCILL